MRVLIARWSRGRDVVKELPDFIHWIDGTKGTFDDYVCHSSGTYHLCPDEHRWVMRMYPETTSKFRYDAAARPLVAGLEWPPIESLELRDLHASDERIREFLYAMPTMYKAETLSEPA